MTEQLDREQSRGLHAERLLEDPLLKESFTKLEAALVSEWKDCKDEARRQRLWEQHHLLARMIGLLQTDVVTGRLAAHELGQVQARKKIFNFR